MKKHGENFFFKKTTNLIYQTAQYIKKTDKYYLKKKRSQFWVKEMKKKCTKKETKAKKNTWESYSVLKKKTKKLNFQPAQ